MATLPFGVQVPDQQAQPAAAQQGEQPQGDYGGFIRQVLTELYQEAHAQVPRAPLAPSPQPLDTWSAAAAAHNPDLLPFLQARADAPGAAKYAQAQQAFQAAMQGRETALGGLVRTLPALTKAEIPPAFLLGVANLSERQRHDLAIENKQQALQKPQIAYDAQGNLLERDAATGVWKRGRTPGGGPIVKPASIAQEQTKRSSEVLKLRLGEARDLIERASGMQPTHPEIGSSHAGTQERSRLSRFGERVAAHDPTGLFSGSDYAADAATYQSFINEIGSLTRSLYGAQGIRSYEEILRLINAMPPWSSGPSRIRQQFDALEKATGVADAELKARRPDLFAETGAPSPQTHGIPRSTWNIMNPQQRQQAQTEGYQIVEGR